MPSLSLSGSLLLLCWSSHFLARLGPRRVSFFLYRLLSSVLGAHLKRDAAGSPGRPLKVPTGKQRMEGRKMPLGLHLGAWLLLLLWSGEWHFSKEGWPGASSGLLLVPAVSLPGFWPCGSRSPGGPATWCEGRQPPYSCLSQNFRPDATKDACLHFQATD